MRSTPTKTLTQLIFNQHIIYIRALMVIYYQKKVLHRIENNISVIH